MLSWQITNALSSLLVPPGLLLVLLAAGLLLGRPRPRTGRMLLISGTAGLYLLSLPVTAHFLLGLWEVPAAAAPADAGAIVVLGGGKAHSTPEYGSDTVRGATLVRLRYAAHLQRRSGLPLLVSGGSPEGSPQTEAMLMRTVLEREFGVPVRWVEDGSANTLENARLSFGILSAQGIRTIHLVTHAWHMRRAQLAFEHAGFQVVPAATGHSTRYRLTVLDCLPDASALLDSALFFREALGIVWYRLRLIFQG
jgi:uncharacterized SAM-binding protein YcdF (DUF218 family)